MSGKEVTIKNGIVRKCSTDIQHYRKLLLRVRFSRILSPRRPFDFTGFHINGKNNLLRNITAIPDGEYGFGIRSIEDNHRVKNSSMAIHAPRIGVSLYDDNINNNTVVSSTIRGAGVSCVTMVGIGNILQGNTIVHRGVHL
jgi:hypothetical protein